MANYDLDEVIDQSPATESVKEPGQEEVKAESENIEEVPEKPGETSQEEKVKEESEGKTEESEQTEKAQTTEDKTEKKPSTKKASDQFTTDSAALKAAENLAIALREDTDFKKMTGEQTRAWYDENRPRLGREGFKGDRSKAKALNETIKEEDKLTRLETKLDNFLEAQGQKQEPEVKAPSAPAKPEFDDTAFNDLMLENPDAANKMLRDFRKAQDDYIEQRIKFESGKMEQTLQPLLDGFSKMAQREQEFEQQKVDKKEWDKAETTVRKFVTEQGDNDFDEFQEAMKKLISEDPATYKGIVEVDGKERAIFKLYQSAKREKQETDRETRLAQLEQEIAALKNGQTLDEINAAKGAARITQTNGGVTQKTPSKPKTPQEIFEEQMRGNSQTRSKYDLEI